MFFNSNPVSQRQTKSFLCFICMPFSCKSAEAAEAASFQTWSFVEYLTAKASTLEDMMGK